MNSSPDRRMLASVIASLFTILKCDVKYKLNSSVTKMGGQQGAADVIASSPANLCVDGKMILGAPFYLVL